MRLLWTYLKVTWSITGLKVLTDKKGTGFPKSQFSEIWTNPKMSLDGRVMFEYPRNKKHHAGQSRQKIMLVNRDKESCWSIETKPSCWSIETKPSCWSIETKPSCWSIETKPSCWSIETKPSCWSIETKHHAGQSR